MVNDKTQSKYEQKRNSSSNRDSNNAKTAATTIDADQLLIVCIKRHSPVSINSFNLEMKLLTTSNAKPVIRSTAASALRFEIAQNSSLLVTASNANLPLLMQMLLRSSAVRRC